MLKKGDILLVAILLIFIAAGFGGLELYKRQDTVTHKIAVIRQNDKVIQRIDLDTVTEPQTIKITGDYSNTILIEKGRIRFEQADCPDKLCVKTGWRTHRGNMAACVPNRAMITIEGENKSVDGVTY